MEDIIYLDKNALKVLVSDTRIDILKRVDERCKTVTELSRELGLTKAAVHEHLSKLSGAGMIRRNDQARRKWVYYELTRKGREILHPNETTKIRILLASASLVFVGGILGIYRFIEGIIALPEAPAVPPYVVQPQIIHEPAYVIAGLTLIAIGVLLSYLGLRIWRNPAHISNFYRSAKT